MITVGGLYRRDLRSLQSHSLGAGNWDIDLITDSYVRLYGQREPINVYPGFDGNAEGVLARIVLANGHRSRSTAATSRAVSQ